MIRNIWPTQNPLMVCFVSLAHFSRWLHTIFLLCLLRKNIFSVQNVDPKNWKEKFILPTGRLYFLCCLARRPINWIGFALRVYNSSYTWRCSSAARRFKVHFFCFILWSRTTFYDSKGFLIHFLLFRLKFRVAIFGTPEVTLAYHYPRLAILANQKRMVNFVKNIPSALVYRTI